ncbi:hypothetical protein NXS19_012701 [Fusarium pseudograminearum]|nr:hypothetical protein NXS19_012701 [Fusarium pseudograminearum]
MSSPSMFDRISSPRQRLSNPLRSPPIREVSEYDLDELEPRSDDVLFDQEPPLPRLRKNMQPVSATSTRRSSSPASWDSKHRYSNSPPHTRSKPIFAGPPPPIASSMMMNQHPSRQSTVSSHGDNGRGYGLISARESTFYSTATSKSRMMNSLHMPTRSTPDGNVIPVRQPVSNKPRGLKSARVGLQRSMAALSELKAEEDLHLSTALEQRKDALAYLDKMSKRRDDIYSELHALEDDEEEPLGQELRSLESEQQELDHDIQRLEEKLAGAKRRRRWVREKMEDVKGRREAGLSGYRAAGRDVDMEVRTMMQTPPIAPLDIDALGYGESTRPKENMDILRGTEFLQLRPERRTVEMARTWWQGEIAALERRKAQISQDRQALIEGSEVWSDVTGLVAQFEAKLRELVRSSQAGDADEEPQQAAMQSQLSEMDDVVQELQKRLQLAESKHWNLLICAIGAELEAFVEAKALLRDTLGLPEPAAAVDSPELSDSTDKAEEASQEERAESHDESDNEVPADLLVSRIEDHDHDSPDSPQQQRYRDYAVTRLMSK